MLNTDLHNPAIKNKISREAFVRNNRGINNGSDVPQSLLLELYDTIQKEEIRMEEDVSLLTFYNPEREGWLAKQGGRVKTWKRRWFILTGNCLYYFKDPSVRTLLDSRWGLCLALDLACLTPPDEGGVGGQEGQGRCTDGSVFVGGLALCVTCVCYCGLTRPPCCRF